MVDLRKLYNILENYCEEDIEVSESDVGETNLFNLVPELGKHFSALKRGIDEVEEAVKDRIKEVEVLKEGLDEIAESLY